MYKFFSKALVSVKQTVNFWIIRRAVTRAAELQFQHDQSAFVDYML